MKSDRKSKEARLLERTRQVELRCEALETGVTRLIPDSYLIELATLAHIAHQGVKRGEESGSSRSHPESKAPTHHPEAQRALALERREMEKRAERLRSAVNQLDPGAYQSESAEATEPGLRVSSQTRNQLGGWAA